MGNTNQSKQNPKINKVQFEVSCTKAKIHLQMMRDRKNMEIIKGEKQLAGKLKSQNRNKVEQQLLAERVTNGLKYAQVCNILASYASTLKSQANYISQNIANPQKIQPWLVYIYSLQFGAQHMGISSLQQYQRVVRSLYSPGQMATHCNKEIVQLLNPTPTAQQINIYVLQMSERNQIPLQMINIIGHKFTKQWDAIPVELDQNILNVRKSFIQSTNNIDKKNQRGQGGQGEQGGKGGQGEQGGQGSTGGGGYNGYIQKPIHQNYQNPYKGASSINNGPTLYQPLDFTSKGPTQKPRQFTSFQQMIRQSQNQNFKLPIYPEINPKQYQNNQYKPIHNPFTRPEQQNDHNSPTLSQIMKDFQRKQ